MALAASRLQHVPIPYGLSISQRVVAVGVALLGAVLSWRYVETPFRKRKLGATRRSVFVLAGAGLAATLASGLLCVFMRGFPQRVPPQAQRFAEAKSDRSFINELTIEDARSGKLVPIGRSDRTARPTVLVWGDSHAMAALPAVDELLKERRLSGCAATHSSTAPVLDWYMQTRYGLNEDAPAFNDCVFAHISHHRIPIVILSAYWSACATSSGGSPTPFASSLLATVRRLVSIGSHPWILMDVPIHRFDVPTTLARSTLFGAGVESLCARPTVDDAWDRIPRRTIDEIVRTGGRVIDPKPHFLSQDGRYYLVELDGVALYRDEQHLTTNGARLILLPLLRETLEKEDVKLGTASRRLGPTLP